MTAEKLPADVSGTEPRNWAEEEVAGEHGRTAIPGSLDDEEHPEIDPQTPDGMARKVKEEASEGEGVGAKLKRALQEVDRTVSGEYERRESAENRDGSPGSGA